MASSAEYEGDTSSFNMSRDELQREFDQLCEEYVFPTDACGMDATTKAGVGESMLICGMPARAADASPAAKICPRCGAELVIRTATRGARKGKQFYGCSSYPRCGYIINID